MTQAPEMEKAVEALGMMKRVYEIHKSYECGAAIRLLEAALPHLVQCLSFTRQREEIARTGNDGMPVPEVMLLQARKPDGGGWTDIWPAQLSWFAREGNEVRALPAPPAGEALPAQEGLHPATAQLVKDFAAELAEKLRAAELKYGYRDGWLIEDWEAECRQHMHEHIAKGDPRDVAIYCAFMWVHGWPTKTRAPAQEGRAGEQSGTAARLIDNAVTGLSRPASPPPSPERGWQPIETAPKDGSEVLLYWPLKDVSILFSRVKIGYWSDHNRFWTWQDRAVRSYTEAPTHWMPLPAAPLVAEPGE